MEPLDASIQTYCIYEFYKRGLQVLLLSADTGIWPNMKSLCVYNKQRISCIMHEFARFWLRIQFVLYGTVFTSHADHIIVCNSCIILIVYLTIWIENIRVLYTFRSFYLLSSGRLAVTRAGVAEIY